MEPIDLVTESLVDQRGREAELDREVHEMRRAIDVLKQKNDSLPEPREETARKIEALDVAAGNLHREIQRRESEHDELIKKAVDSAKR
ncbi:hypothetical protein HDU85_006319 [Gaertneriomyces sp. JEL0708]|nr:hypothetical protein HDU85_006319 [Gaertneriomyces sp. JEL0708]